MIELLSLQKIVADEETFTLEIQIPKSLYPHYKIIFESLFSFADNLSYKAKLAQQLNAGRQEEWKRKQRESFEQLKAQMRDVYDATLQETGNAREAMKEVTRRFKEYSSQRKEFRADIKARQELEIERLSSEGLNSFQIAERLKLDAGYIRTILSRRR